MAVSLPLCIWWLAESSLVCCFTFDFLLRVTGADGRRYLPAWLAANGAATLAVVLFRPPAAFLFSVLFPCVFAAAVLKIPVPSLAAPMAAIAVLCTLKEGFSALLLSWLSVSFRSPSGGIAEQLLISFLLDALLFAALWMLQARYPQGRGRPAPFCLRLLLPSCVFVLLAIRCGLRLDHPDFASFLAAFGANARLSALFSLAGAAVIVFAAFAAFCRLACLSEQEKLLRDQLVEIKGRNQSYAAFQHDIHNHLLVISGLLRERSFSEAEQYTNLLQLRSGPLLAGVSTGRPALDVLLREKQNAAKRDHIAVRYDIGITAGFAVDDTDLCALFSNILDNAIAACLNEPEDSRFLTLSAKAKSKLLIIEAVNSTSASGPVLFGTGLGNIRRIAQLYQGTMEAEQCGGRFRISVLLCSR